jgi:peptidoglycan/LPS O-acetylase OafA/YrhL
MRIPFTPFSFLRLASLVVIGFAAAMFMPVFGDESAQGLHFIVAVFVAMVLVLLIAESAARRQKLLETVRVELNKLRRMYHVSKNLAEPVAQLRPWFTEVHGLLYAYLSKFSGKDFNSYDDFNAEFRKLSYHIYTIPKIETPREQVLYQDLLHTTSVVAEARQQIKELWDNRLSAYSWAAAVLLAFVFFVSVALSVQDTVSSRLAGGAAISAVLLALGLLWEADALSLEKRLLARRYVDNISRLELSRKKLEL